MHVEAVGFRLKKAWVWSVCIPAVPLTSWGPQASRLGKNNLSLLGELCGLAEVVWGADWPTGRSLADARAPLPGLAHLVQANSLKCNFQ